MNSRTLSPHDCYIFNKFQWWWTFSNSNKTFNVLFDKCFFHSLYLTKCMIFTTKARIILTKLQKTFDFARIFKLMKSKVYFIMKRVFKSFELKCVRWKMLFFKFTFEHIYYRIIHLFSNIKIFCSKWKTCKNLV